LKNGKIRNKKEGKKSKKKKKGVTDDK